MKRSGGESGNGKLRDEFLNGESFVPAEGGTNADIEVGRGIQHGAATLGAGLQATAPQAILPKQQGHGDMENAPCFPHPHTPGAGAEIHQRVFTAGSSIKPAAKQVIKIPDGHPFGFHNLRHMR